jgi:imidazolonepropionase-like amidohydrolase
MDAIASVTSVPAHAMGVDDRVGSIQKGFDGDVVVWDRHPLLYLFRTVFTLH